MNPDTHPDHRPNQHPDHHPDKGTVLSDRYTLTERVAVGGMGEVWAATDTVLRRTVAVKLLRPALSQESDFVERFRAEARHTAALHHPNIATVFDYGEDHGTAYLVMELVVGRPLSQIIAERAPLSAQETASILIQAATALEAAHQGGVVHRDVTPANILITADGTVKLTDFGISRAVDSVPLTQTGQVLGTAQYLSPERALGQSATAASDIYALGVVGHEMLTGERPFDTGSVVSTALAHVNQPPPPLPDTLPPGIRELISAALAKDPADRPASAAAMAHALGMPDAAFAAAAPTQAMSAQTRTMPAQTRTMPAQTPGTPDRRSRGGSPWLLGAVVAVVLGVLTVFALSWVSDSGSTKPPVARTSTAVTTSPTPISSAIATYASAPPAVTSSAPNQPASGQGPGNGKKKGK